MIGGSAISVLDDSTGVIALYHHWYEESDTLFAQLSNSPSWQTRTIKLFGKTHPIPRLEQFTGDQGVTYLYSRQVYQARGWLAALVPLVNRLEQCFCWRPNAALLNRYRNGSDKMGWHSDDEPDLGAEPSLAILSLGGQRAIRFRLKSNYKHSLKIELAHGSLLWMSGPVQQYWQHSINPQARAAERISCTFRKVVRPPVQN